MRRSELYGRLAGTILLISTTAFNAYPQGTEVDFSSIPKSGTILINSHMDDDLIWMLPFWEKTDKFICGAMPQTPGYRTIISQQQTFLNNNNYNIQYLSNWYTPWNDVTNTEYVRYYLEADPSYNYLLNDHLETRLYNNPTPLSRFEINKIKAKLEQYFADPSMSRAITHNNWGEYGHQHHIGLNKAVRELAVKYRKDVWMLGCDNGAFIDVNVPSGITYTYAAFNDPNLYTGIRTIYSNNGLWTWSATTVPSGNHKFIKIVDAGSDKSNILKGDEISYPGPSQLMPGSYIFDGNDDYLTLRGNNNPSFTIMMKVRPDMIREMDIAAMSEFPLSTKNDRNIFLTGDGHITARIFDGNAKVVTSSATFSAQTWNHVAITGNGSEFKLYVNGILDRTITSGTAITDYSTPELLLGLATETSTNFSGQIYDVKMLDHVLSDNEIAVASGMVFTITSTAGSGGSIDPSGTTNALILSDRTYTITPSTGYHISDVLADNVSVGPVSTYTFTSVTSNHTISASFAPSASHIVTATAGEGGSVSPSGDVTVYELTSQVFNIIPAIGQKIKDVIVDTVSVGPVSSYTFSNITGDHTISATFEVTPTYVIGVTAGPGGTVSPAGDQTVNEASSHTFSIIPSTGYKVTDVLIDGVSVGPVTTYTFNNILANHTISATFEIRTYTLTGTSGPGGTITPAGTLTLNHGTGQTYSFHPETGYRISDVRIDNVSVGTPSEYVFSNLDANHTIAVSFMIIINTITASAEPGGNISPSGNVPVAYGNNQTFSMTTGTGYHINDVLVDGVSQGAISSYTFTSVTSNHSISAEFTPITYTITASAGNGGTISPSGNITVNHGSNRIFSFIPAYGYQINDVRIDNVSEGPVSSYTFTDITENHTISVSFTTATYTVQASAGTGGTITPSGTETVTHGSDITYTVAPTTGYRIADVRVDNSSIGAVNTYTFNNVTSNHAITASFALITFDITASAGSGGTVSPAGTTSVNYGSSRTYSIIPNAGYSIVDVMADNISVGPVSSYIFSNVTSNHSISATFSANRYTVTANAGQGGNVTPSGVTTVTYGTQVTININPSTGYRISDVLVDNVSAGAITTYTFSNIAASHSLTASFVPITFRISSTAGNGGTISPLGTTEVNYGSAMTYMITPSTGYKISGLLIDGVSAAPVSSFTFSNITGNHSIAVSFSLIRYSISAESNSGGNINPAGVSEVDHGSGITFTITPDDGFRVKDVVVDGTSKGKINIINRENISSDHKIAVAFELIPRFSINATAGIGGVISPSGPITLTEGSAQTYTVTPEQGYRIHDIIVDGISAGVMQEYQFRDISSDHSIRAEFTTAIEVIAFPNPFINDFRVFIASPDNLDFELSIADSGGRIIYSQKGIQGNIELPVNLDLPDGIYFLRIYRGTKKIAVLKMINGK
jgi:hypothetical protein